MPADTIEFTVVIPVYNGAAYIARAVESCLQQSFLPKQIIIIDDASTDETSAIVQNLSNERISYHRSNQNHGSSYSRNIGIELATASWIAFLDADDIFHPQKLEIIRYCIENNQNIRAIGHAFDLESNTKIVLASNWKIQLPILQYLNGKDVLWRNPMVTPSLVVSAENRIFFNEEMVYAEDHDFILRTAEKFGVHFLNIPLCSLERLPLTPGGISSNKWKMRVGEMRMYIGYGQRHNNYFIIPFLVLFSLLKHTKNIFLHR